MKRITKNQLLKRNISLLLDFYNYTPEQYIDRFGITSNLTEAYDMFNGKQRPSKVDLRRIVRLLGISARTLTSRRDLIPVIIKAYELKWQANDSQVATLYEVPVDRVKKWKHSHVLSSLDFKIIARGTGVTPDLIRQMASAKYYFSPRQNRSNEPRKIQKVMLVSLKRAKWGVKLLGQSMEDPHSWSNDDETWEGMYESIKQLKTMIKVVGDLGSYRYAHKAFVLSAHWSNCPTQHQLDQMSDGFYNKAEYKQHKEYERRYHHNLNNCIHIDKLLNKLIQRYEPRKKYEHDTSRKYCVIAGVNLSGTDYYTSRVDYLIYGLKPNDWGGDDKVVTYDRTVPGLANLDPEWQRLTYEQGILSDYFDVYGFHKMNDYIKACSLSRKQLKELVTALHDQGLSYAKILPCDQIDYWLNHHNAEYREKGDEEA